MPSGKTERKEKMEKTIEELEMKLWFSENELYSDGSNIYDWLPKLKIKLQSVFNIDLETKE